MYAVRAQALLPERVTGVTGKGETTMPDAVFKVHGESRSGTATVVRARGFEIVIDEPPAFGGEDAGPNPVEYVLASLAGCINVVGHLVAAEMGIRIRGLKMTVSGKLNPDRFSGRSTHDRAGFKEIRVSLDAETDASEDKLAAWMHRIEQRCPVADNLGNATEIRLCRVSPLTVSA